MAGSAQLWPGPSMRAFFRSILAAEPGVDARTAEILSERLSKRIARMLVWDTSGLDATYDGHAPANEASETKVSVPDKAEPESQARQSTSKQVPHVTDTTKAKPATAEPRAADPFDPFAFSVIVILKRQGRAALMKRLEAIDDANHLRQIAEAQHLGIDKSIGSVKKLREAIILGAEQRLADRRAAAS